MCTNCSKTKLSGSAGTRQTAPSKVTYANRISGRPSGSSGSFGKPSVKARFSGRK